MGDRTLFERVLGLEQCVAALRDTIEVLTKKSVAYDKIIQTRAAQRRALKKARAVKKRKNG